MTLFERVPAWLTARRLQLRSGITLGLVPTMGALHEGHRSLIRRSRAENAKTLVSIFVNPTQFDDPADVAGYPRTLESDLAVLREELVDFALVPGHAELYADDYRYRIVEERDARTLEGAHRPGHFDGVLTVVMKLLQLAAPERAYFGEKDWQQLLVVRRLVHDLSLPVEIVGCPIVREDDGLALSSRNVHLTPEQRAAATVLHRALLAGRDAPSDPEAAMRRVMATEPLADLDYAAVRDGRLLIAARFGPVRLIDNCPQES
jgi:pantoate--beta-alanine ligase